MARTSRPKCRSVTWSGRTSEALRNTSLQRRGAPRPVGSEQRRLVDGEQLAGGDVAQHGERRRAAACALSRPKLCTSSWPREVSVAPSDAGADRTTGGVHQAHRALVHHDQAGLPPGLGGELRGQAGDPGVEHPVQPGRTGLGEVQHREADAVGAGREVEAVEARGAEEAAVDEGGGGADRRRATGRRRPRGAPALRSRCAIAGPVTRNDTGAWSIRGPSSSPASRSSPACTAASTGVAPDQRGDVRVPGRPHQRDLRRGDRQRLRGVHPGVVREQDRRGRWRPARPGAARRPPWRRTCTARGRPGPARRRRAASRRRR